MTYVRKTRDEWAVELSYGYGDGWEEACAEETRREGIARLREYRENQPEYPARLRKRRVPLDVAFNVFYDAENVYLVRAPDETAAREVALREHGAGWEYIEPAEAVAA